jgi:eukaryotic-like serine/threonine-protein kinase
MSPQESIAHYRIIAKLGEGGMGAVYRATDTKLNRDVAIKILPDAFAADPDRLARFTREAQVLAALNHPNIAAIYGVEDRALVMELVEGEELKGPLPVETALQYALQIAEALEAAHDKGIIHRDLKPANIKVTPHGMVKVLDFGLAAMTLAPTSSVNDPVNSPTITIRATMAGVIMGTAGYMAPEQAAGKPVDRRADIWSFGVVLYELLMGTTLFQGETVSHTLAAVLKDAIDFDALKAPAPVRELVRRCLERDPRNRMQAIGEARIAIQKYLANPTGESVASAQPVPSPSARKLPWAIAGALGIAAAAFAFLAFRPSPPPRLMRFEIHPPTGSELALGVPAPSPDGSMIAYIVTGPDRKSRIHVRPIDRVETRELPGTEGAMHVFWSPDSKSLAFNSNTQMKRIDLVGGAPRDLTKTTGPFHGAWTPDGHILVASNGFGIARIPAEGGTATEMGLGGFPEVVDDRRFLFLSERHSIQLLTLGEKRQPAILEVDSAPILARTPVGKSYLLYARSIDLMAQPFDEGSGKTKGSAVVIVSGIGRVARGGLRPAVGVSPAGILAYEAGTSRSDYGPTVVVDRSGKTVDTLPLESSGQNVELSPDGLSAAFLQVDQSAQRDIWVTDLARKSATRVTFGSTKERSYNGIAWSPDSKRIASRAALFAGLGDGAIEIVEVGNPSNVQMIKDPVRTPHSWSPDGKLILGTSRSNRISLVPVAGDGQEIPVGSPNGRSSFGQISPDGKYIAYVSNESGKDEVYVQPAPPGAGRVKVSISGGTKPRWRRDGRELYFIAADDGLMAVDVTASKGFSAGLPHRLFLIKDISRQSYDVHPDGQHFVITTPPQGSTETVITVVLNWWAQLKN